MALRDAHAETRLPAQDLDRARRWYADKLDLHPDEEREGGLMYRLAGGAFALFTSTGASRGEFTQLALNVDDIEVEIAHLRARGVVFEEYDIPGFPMTDGVVEVDGNYPSKGSSERGAWFRDSEDNLIGLGQSIP